MEEYKIISEALNIMTISFRPNKLLYLKKFSFFSTFFYPTKYNNKKILEEI